jgi:uncharacterized protein (DUF1919 family)
MLSSITKKFPYMSVFHFGREPKKIFNQNCIESLCLPHLLQASEAPFIQIVFSGVSGVCRRWSTTTDMP